MIRKGKQEAVKQAFSGDLLLSFQNHPRRSFSECPYPAKLGEPSPAAKHEFDLPTVGVSKLMEVKNSAR